MASQEILTEVPLCLKKLVRYIVRGFYGLEYAIVIDILVRNPCMKEDDIAELLKFGKKHLRTLINSLKQDKFLKAKMKLETEADGRATRHNYYFINYKVFVNVVKYKLDHMRKKIQTEERDSTNRASFKCQQCDKSYSDLEADRLFDMMTCSYRCTFCQTEVIEDEVVLPNKDALAMAKFNDQIEPIIALLRECEDIRLAPEILEPEPMDMKLINSRNHNLTNRKPQDHTTWSGDIRKNIGFEVQENTVTVSMEEDQQASNLETKTVKEQPVWMKESTVEGAIIEPTGTVEIQPAPGPSLEEPHYRRSESDDIMRTLLVHEKKSAVPNLPGGALGGAGGSGDESSTSESEDEAVKPPPFAPIIHAKSDVVEMESEEEDEMPLVTIGGDLRVPLNEVTGDLVERMTPAEKEIYIQLAQEMHNNMYD